MNMGSRALVLCGPSPLTPSTFVRKPRRSRRVLSSDQIGSSLAISAAKNSLFFLGSQSLAHIVHGGTKRSFAVCNSADPSGVPLPPGPPSDSWKWILGFVVTFVVPFLTSKWGPLLKITNKVEAAVQTVENVVDAVEKVAEKVEEVAGNVAENLPAGSLKNTLLRVENVADQIDDDAELIGDLIDKVQDVEDKVESAIESAEEAEESLKEVKARQEAKKTE